MENRKRYTAIVLAAGSGRRMQSDTPKQFMELCGHPLVYYSLYAFEKSPVDDIILVTGKDDVSYCRKEIVEACDFRKVRAVIPGGKERYLSVYEGLKAAAGTDYVLIHDGARPMIDETEIRLSMRAVEEEHACVIGVPVKDTIKVGNAKHYAVDTPDRSCLWAGQTPQSFKAWKLRSVFEALTQEEKEILTDACKILVMKGEKVRRVQGEVSNIKITYPHDLRVAEAILGGEKKC
mgnify:CR=1 FL=1